MKNKSVRFLLLFAPFCCKDIHDNPGIVSFNNYKLLYRYSELAESNFKEFKAVNADHIDPDMVERDITSLQKAVQGCVSLADRRLAHSDTRPVENHPSFIDLHKCITLIEKLAVKYRLILTAFNGELTDKTSDDWKEVFRVPWIDPGT